MRRVQRYVSKVRTYLGKPVVQRRELLIAEHGPLLGLAVFRIGTVRTRVHDEEGDIGVAEVVIVLAGAFYDGRGRGVVVRLVVVEVIRVRRVLERRSGEVGFAREVVDELVVVVDVEDG